MKFENKTPLHVGYNIFRDCEQFHHPLMLQIWSALGV